MMKSRFHIIFAIFIILFFLKSSVYLDPDFGWHLRFGQITIGQGIPRDDPFSYTMAGYQYVEHSWLPDLITAKIYPVGGYSILALAAAVIATLAIIVATLSKSGKKLESLSLLPIILALPSFLSFVGVRPLVFSWLLFSIVVTALFNERLWQKFRFVVPLLFFVWSNLHGGFGAGLGAMAVFLFLRFWHQKKIVVSDTAVFLASVGATLINPYGVRLWREVAVTVLNLSLSGSVVEWTPTFLRLFDPALVILGTMTTVLIIRYRRRFTLEKLGLFGAFLVLAISGERHIPLFLLICLPLSVDALWFFSEEAERNSLSRQRLKKLSGLFVVAGTFLVILESLIIIRNYTFLSEPNFYPSGAIKYLSKSLPDGQIFAPYNWGGYFIWKLPEKKVFVDGRMPSWRWDNPLARESTSAFNDYHKLISGGTDYKPIFERFMITTVVWPIHKKEPLLEKKRSRSGYDFLGALLHDGWREVYRDSVAVVLRKD